MNDENQMCGSCEKDLGIPRIHHADVPALGVCCEECSGGVSVHDQVRALHEQARVDRADAAVAAIETMVNDMAFGGDQEFAPGMMRMHRTNQQSAFGAMLSCVTAWGSLTDVQYDARNEWTVKQCRKIMEALDIKPGDRPR